jgi:glucose dehydrogenase
MVDGTLYLSTPGGRAIALDPETGVVRGSFDADIGGNWGDFANRDKALSRSSRHS